MKPDHVVHFLKVFSQHLLYAPELLPLHPLVVGNYHYFHPRFK